MSIWKTGELFLVSCTNDHDVRDKYQFVRNYGFERVHFMVNCSAQQILQELVDPTKFENPNLDYYCSFGQEPEPNLEYSTKDGEMLSFVDGQLFCNNEPMCEQCFKIGQVTLVKHCSTHNKSKQVKRKRECECGKVKHPTFNVPGEKIGRWCVNCEDKPSNAIDVKHKLCTCGKRPSFNLPGKKTPIWCDDCVDKPPNAVDVVSKLCICGKARPIFNVVGEFFGKWCDKCEDKPPNAVDVVNKMCVCGKARPTFNVPGEKIAIWCIYCEDKPPNAVDVVNKKCVCGKSQPSFNLVGEKIPIWCVNCEDKPPNAVDIVKKRCVCGKAKPIFNVPGEKIGKWCVNCEDKPPNAIDVKNKMCICGKAQPTFNLPGEKIPIWCNNCEDKPPNAVNVKSKMCPCGKIPSFNLPSEKIAIWCDTCEDKPINAVDVKHKLCNCGNSRANFNVPGQTPKYCGSCRKFGMVFQPRKKCKLCKKLAIFGIDNQRFHCEEHKTNQEFNLVERKCGSCGLMEVLDNNNICRTCDPTNFKKYIQRKEYHIKDLLDAHKLKHVHNKVFNGVKCGRERADFVFDFGDHIIILEVDENQHKSYPEECEKIRMFNITQSCGGIPVFWIRYNPDDFKVKNAKRKCNITQNKREEHLIKWLKWSFQRDMKHLGEVVYLFYDGCNDKTFQSDISVLIPFELM